VLVDDALDGLCRASRSVGIPDPSPPTDLGDLEALEAEIAPMRIPADVRRFWERVDASTLRIEPYPGLHGPDFALTAWRMSRDEFTSAQPLALVQIAYTSQMCMSAELDVGDLAGGALFEWDVVDGPFIRRYNGIAEWLHYLERLIAVGNMRRRDTERGPFLHVPDPDRWAEERETRPVPERHPFHGEKTSVGRDILEWPEHWQRAAGLRPEHLALRGATHSIAELLATPSEQRVRATIVAQVVDLAGGGTWARVRADDGTGRLDVFCPEGTTLLGPRSGDWFEFDVVVDAGARILPPDPDAAAARAEAAGADDLERVAEILLARYGGPAGATAEAIRRAAPPSTS
jgi:hypothetical protein